MRILIVEDEEMYLYILSEILSGAGYHTLGADSGPRALELLKQQPVDIVITDQRMMPMDGLELIRQMRTVPAFKNIPVIMVTGDDSMDTIIRAADSAVDGYIIKPFDAEAVLRKVKLVSTRSADGP